MYICLVTSDEAQFEFCVMMRSVRDGLMIWNYSVQFVSDLLLALKLSSNYSLLRISTKLTTNKNREK